MDRSAAPGTKGPYHEPPRQLRNPQTLVEIGVDKNSTVVFPAPLMSTIGKLDAFLTGESAAAARPAPGTTDNTVHGSPGVTDSTVNGSPVVTAS